MRGAGRCGIRRATVTQGHKPCLRLPLLGTPSWRIRARRPRRLPSIPRRRHSSYRHRRCGAQRPEFPFDGFPAVGGFEAAGAAGGYTAGLAAARDHDFKLGKIRGACAPGRDSRSQRIDFKGHGQALALDGNDGVQRTPSPGRSLMPCFCRNASRGVVAAMSKKDEFGGIHGQGLSSRDGLAVEGRETRSVGKFVRQRKRWAQA